jgi:hypothetical protein
MKEKKGESKGHMDGETVIMDERNFLPLVLLGSMPVRCYGTTKLLY